MTATPSPVGLPTWEDYRPGDPDVCVWCHVTGCSIQSIEVQHGATCPSVTGMWPVTPRHVQRSTCCAVDGCDHVFQLGEYMAEIPHPDKPDQSISVCVICSLLHRDDAWKDHG